MPPASVGCRSGAGIRFPGQAARRRWAAASRWSTTSHDAPGLIFDELAVSKRESLAAHREDWKKVVEQVWFRTVDFIKDPATHDEAVKIMSGKVNVPPADYDKSLGGTAILGLNENLKAMQKSDDMLSVYGSMKISDAFYTKYAVYKDAQKTGSYVTPRLIEEVTGKKAPTMRSKCLPARGMWRGGCKEGELL